MMSYLWRFDEALLYSSTHDKPAMSATVSCKMSSSLEAIADIKIVMTGG